MILFIYFFNFWVLFKICFFCIFLISFGLVFKARNFLYFLVFIELLFLFIIFIFILFSTILTSFLGQVFALSINRKKVGLMYLLFCGFSGVMGVLIYIAIHYVFLYIYTPTIKPVNTQVDLFKACLSSPDFIWPEDREDLLEFLEAQNSWGSTATAEKIMDLLVCHRLSEYIEVFQMLEEPYIFFHWFRDVEFNENNPELLKMIKNHLYARKHHRTPVIFCVGPLLLIELLFVDSLEYLLVKDYYYWDKPQYINLQRHLYNYTLFICFKFAIWFDIVTTRDLCAQGDLKTNIYQSIHNIRLKKKINEQLVVDT